MWIIILSIIGFLLGWLFLSDKIPPADLSHITPEIEQILQDIRIFMNLPYCTSGYVKITPVNDKGQECAKDSNKLRITFRVFYKNNSNLNSDKKPSSRFERTSEGVYIATTQGTYNTNFNKIMVFLHKRLSSDFPYECYFLDRSTISTNLLSKAAEYEYKLRNK
ncbi:MAG: hypothetical protein IJN68_01135 [Clostridia bacterium]|nr:hypothetical protein [Clostridia bacterium]